MAPCPWFPEAVRLLRENPQYDVGVHLVLTSEWENIKWGPLTKAKSLVNEDGYFYRTYWKGDHNPDEITFRDISWLAEEVEQELRTQIELTLKHFPWASHMGIHMGGLRADKKIKAIYDELAEQYGLAVDLGAHGFERFRGFGENSVSLTSTGKIAALVKNLASLTPGKWIFVDHPAYDTPEMRAIYHRAYENVALDRQGVADAWTSEQVKEIVERRKIKFISYADVKNGLVG